ncbi:two-component system response regulator [Sphingobium yanoikuyae]|uniref:response regulator transcription factor n=1 Tax=Sphingobium yanoikuyae TaxID=13690 RepID=UPI0007A73833|nr:response regulator [Sphingobium yanoikuyae]KZC75998.1 two-component system response regulator [Sphingobium yanoikuyae]
MQLGGIERRADVVEGLGAAASELVHVIDDDPSMRSAVTRLLRSVEVVAVTYESANAFLEAHHPDVPSCLLLDVRLPGISGLDFQSRLEALGIHMPVIMITAHGDIQMTVQAMKAGAIDFLEKPFRDQALIDAVATAIEQDKRRRRQQSEQVEIIQRYETLSDRERQVMGLITNGALNKQAAFELGLSEITIKVHRATAMKKMGARTLPDLVKLSERLRPGE